MKLLIKLSGESLSERGGDGSFYAEPVLERIAEQIRALQSQGHQIALVIGGGNLFRGHKLTEKLSIERPTADYIGMLATVQNALILRDYFQTKGIATRVSSAIAMPQICESYIPKRALRHMEKGRIMIFAAGLGAPYFTTDSTAVQRALEMGADMLIMAKNGVDGLYTGDPKKNKRATFIKSITGSKVLEQNLKAADQSAIALAKEHGLTIKIVGVDMIKSALETKIGSVILPE
ncbi:MAG: UMP kinase [Candidatus Lloydbacteria bacterium RIFCSPLOWO2_01_FULL_50_20]|uniref:Uridylate kinase n=1 Tax=Candidatus Lloydbacteria bacterium RIFCSPLOWO2_01_FULL_50_20 TaxID=1798665 RepID=A0A1G2DCZ4_9BACT|nr:MAG: UMP kinase [Candidatus Lloydbacteria bacterium RIFCSPHIGHO2_02_FULL_50_11]OGZ11383.1 MAG: UMP kinase [Candidatus Lloydbacteria bacterium RIFCSPLOWO2_01_FULL_50_20]